MALAQTATERVWYPFTQHDGLSAEDITTVDARSGEHFRVFKQDHGSSSAAVAEGVGQVVQVHRASGPRIEPHYDACASWWTQVCR